MSKTARQRLHLYPTPSETAQPQSPPAPRQDKIQAPLPQPAPDYRVGIGVDSHPLAPGRPLVLGGAAIPHDRGLAGHSDGDVLIHALMDALLGAANLGDKGTHFPSSDPQYRGISSLLLLERVAGLLAAAGWRVSNVDVTMLAQTPRLGPFIPTMKERTAAALSLAPGRVSIKATTTDYLGFVGRAEGIAAVAIAAILSDPDAPQREQPAAPPSSRQ